MAGTGKVGEELILAATPTDDPPYALHRQPLVASFDDRDQREDEPLHDGERRRGFLVRGEVRVVGEARVQLPAQIVLHTPMGSHGLRKKVDVVEGKQIICPHGLDHLAFSRHSDTKKSVGLEKSPTPCKKNIQKLMHLS